MDRISELPTEILHQILSLLPPKTAARTAVLSKPWLRACYTNPYLYFDESDFEAPLHNGMAIDFHDQFLTIVDNTLVRYCHENLPISTFKLNISFPDQTDCEGLVNKWLYIIANRRASEVALLVQSKYGNYSSRYSLIAASIFSIASLQHLEINNCKLRKQKSLLSEDEIKCRNLKDLTLCSVTITESTLDSLISCCPKIQTIWLEYCISLSCIRLPKDLPNLLSLSILFCPITEVHIGDAPKMLSFKYESGVHSYDETCLRMLTIGTCQNLRRIEFVETEIDDTLLFKLIPKLHCIKELILHYCKYLNKIKISSSTLEVCSIECCENLVQATFDVPKLLSLVVTPNSNFYMHKLPCLSFESASSQCRISINDVDLLYDPQEFIDLRRSLVELNGKVVDLTLRSISIGLRLASGMDHLPPPQVENLILTYSHFSDKTYSSYLNDIFWICWPKNLTLHCSKNFRKFLRQKLLKKCRWRPSKCSWIEYFTNAQIDCLKSRRDDWITLDWKMLAANPQIIEEIHTIRFKQTQRKEIKKESCILRCIPR